MAKFVLCKIPSTYNEIGFDMTRDEAKLFDLLIKKRLPYGIRWAGTEFICSREDKNRSLQKFDIKQILKEAAEEMYDICSANSENQEKRIKSLILENSGTAIGFKNGIDSDRKNAAFWEQFLGL